MASIPRILLLILALLAGTLGCPASSNDGEEPPAPDGDEDGSPDELDCNDGNPAIHPGAEEICNGIDDDCDDAVDEDLDSTWHADDDGDGYGDPGDTRQDCAQPDGYIDEDTDCDDGDDTVHPGAEELCDGIDNNCDLAIDGLDAVDTTTWYADTDGDGYGDPTASFVGCDQPAGFVTDNSDCDDNDAGIFPGQGC